MSLLFHTITEYLEDNHQPWYAINHHCNSISIEHPYLDDHIKIYESSSAIVIYSHCIYGKVEPLTIYYTDHTIIQCIDKMIEMVIYSMSLLRRTVDEYLKEHHPLWEVEDYLNMNMYIYPQDTSCRFITIDTRHQIITSYKYKLQQYCRYSERDLLQNLTNIINSQ